MLLLIGSAIWAASDVISSMEAVRAVLPPSEDVVPGHDQQPATGEVVSSADITVSGTVDFGVIVVDGGKEILITKGAASTGAEVVITSVADVLVAIDKRAPAAEVRSELSKIAYDSGFGGNVAQQVMLGLWLGHFPGIGASF